MHTIAVESCDPLCFYREPNRLSEICSDMEKNSEAIGEDGRRAENHQMACHVVVVHFLASIHVMAFSRTINDFKVFIISD